MLRSVLAPLRFVRYRRRVRKRLKKLRDTKPSAGSGSRFTVVT